MKNKVAAVLAATAIVLLTLSLLWCGWKLHVLNGKLELLREACFALQV